MEQTLVVFKPDSLQRGIVGEIITRFERAGLKIVGLKMMAPDKEHYHSHYETIGKVKSRHGADVFDIALFNMMEGPVIAAVFEGIHAVEVVRKLIGSTDPGQALPGTIRGDYAHSRREFANAHGRTLPNIVHASADAKEAKEEIALWFSAPDLYEYETVHEKAVHGKQVKK
jgi:nucleoside-diphosphate kinase